MAELNAAEAEQQAEASFAGGFTGTPPTDVAKVVPESKVETNAEVVPASAPAAKPVKPQYVRVTQQEWDNTKAMIGKVSSLESRIAKQTGSPLDVDAIVQQVMEKMQFGALSDEDFVELAEDFPELAKHTRAGIERVFKKGFAGTPKGAPEPKAEASVRGTVDDDAIAAAVERSLTKKEMAGLEEAHPAWMDIVGAVDTTKGETPPADNPFRQWLATQPADFQRKIGETKSPAEIRAAIDKFKASAPSVAARPDRAATRRAAIEDAVTPRFDGSAPPLVQTKTADEAFAESFEKTRRK